MGLFGLAGTLQVNLIHKCIDSRPAKQYRLHSKHDRGLQVETVYVFDESKVPAVIRAAYSLSQPQGLGFLHFESGELPDEDVNEILACGWGSLVCDMDYVRGRAVKLGVFRRPDGKCQIHADRWYDHSNHQLVQLALTADIGMPQAREAT